MPLTAKLPYGLLLACAKHSAMTSSDSLLSVAVFLKGGDVISCQKTPFVVVGGVLQLTKQRLWLLTPLTQLLPDPSLPRRRYPQFQPIRPSNPESKGRRSIRPLNRCR